MNKVKMILNAVKFAEEFLEKAESSHDWWHTFRVWQMAVRIADQEKADNFIVSMAAILHDLADHKLHNGSDERGMEFVGGYLLEINVSPEERKHILEIIENLSFRKTFDEKKVSSIEGRIVQDADRLDALGAIGISRAFDYGGARGREIYDPYEEITEYKNSEEYKNSNTSAINHFHEKLLLLKDKMNTETAKKIAEHRHKFMKEYIEEFMAEWRGEA